MHGVESVIATAGVAPEERIIKPWIILCTARQRASLQIIQLVPLLGASCTLQIKICTLLPKERVQARRLQLRPETCRSPKAGTWRRSRDAYKVVGLLQTPERKASAVLAIRCVRRHGTDCSGCRRGHCQPVKGQTAARGHRDCSSCTEAGRANASATHGQASTCCKCAVRTGPGARARKPRRVQASSKQTKLLRDILIPGQDSQAQRLLLHQLQGFIVVLLVAEPVDVGLEAYEKAKSTGRVKFSCREIGQTLAPL